MKGQAVVEFVLTLLLVMVVVGAVSQFMRNNSGVLWKRLTCEISAPCPGCGASDSAKNVHGALKGMGSAQCK